MKKITLLLSVLMMSVFASASDLTVKPLIGMKAQFGGDTLLTIVYTDSTTQDINAGNGIDFYAGVLAESAPFAVKASIGYKYSTSAATNIDVAKTAIPLNLTARYVTPSDVYVGAGLTQHLNPQLSVDDVVAEFDAAPGFHVEAGWKAISVGWTSMTYSIGNTEYDASSIDINLELVF